MESFGEPSRAQSAISREIPKSPQYYKFSQCHAVFSASPNFLVVRPNLLWIWPSFRADGRELAPISTKADEPTLVLSSLTYRPNSGSGS